MTSPNFDSRYQLLKCVAVSDGIRTHNALEAMTGRVVMVHLADAAGPEVVDALRAELGRLPQSDKARILETATVSAGFAVVTEFLQGLTNFPDWLAARVLPEQPRAESSDVDGFSIEQLRLETLGAEFAATVPPLAAAPPPPPAATKPPGEFTSLFGVMSPPSVPAAPTPATASPPSPSLPTSAAPPPARAAAPAPMLGDVKLASPDASPLSSLMPPVVASSSPAPAPSIVPQTSPPVAPPIMSPIAAPIVPTVVPAASIPVTRPAPTPVAIPIRAIPPVSSPLGGAVEAPSASPFGAPLPPPIVPSSAKPLATPGAAATGDAPSTPRSATQPAAPARQAEPFFPPAPAAPPPRAATLPATPVAPPKAPAPAQPPASAGPPAGELSPGEFTQLFQLPSAPPSGGGRAPAAPPSAFPDFGRPDAFDALSAPPPKAPPAPPKVSPPRVQPLPPPKGSGGDQFSPFVGAGGPSPVEPRGNVGGAGLGNASPLGGPPPGASPFGVPPSGASPLGTPRGDAGFGPPASGKPSAPPPSMGGSPAGASPIGASPLGQSPLGAGSVPLPPVMPAPNFGALGAGSPLGSGGAARRDEPAPGAYTQMIRQSATPAPELPSDHKPAAATPPSKKRSIPLGLILALNAVLVLAIVLVLYFVFRPKPPEALPGGGLPTVPTAPKVPDLPSAPSAPSVTLPKK